jgi:hypothetical protein
VTFIERITEAFRRLSPFFLCMIEMVPPQGAYRLSILFLVIF